MILVDSNLLIYASVRSFPQHDRARHWLDERLSDSARVGLPWPSLLGFLRIVTNPRIFAKPLSMPLAWGQLEAWLGNENVWIPRHTPRHAGILAQMLESSGSGANLVPDADLAALAVEHGLNLCSTDGDFARFVGLKWTNPLTP